MYVFLSPPHQTHSTSKLAAMFLRTESKLTLDESNNPPVFGTVEKANEPSLRPCSQDA